MNKQGRLSRLERLAAAQQPAAGEYGPEFQARIEKRLIEALTEHGGPEGLLGPPTGLDADNGAGAEPAPTDPERKLTMQTRENTEAETLTAEEIAALIGDAPACTPEAFCPVDAGGVDWVLRKVAAARGEAKLIRENMERMARACERDAEALEWKYGGAIQTYLEGQPEGGTRESVSLPHGVPGYRPRPAPEPPPWPGPRRTCPPPSPRHWTGKPWRSGY